MKKILLSGCLLLAVQLLQAQSAQSFYVELGGPGMASFNFDSRFSGKEDGLGGRIGFGGYSEYGDSELWFPLEVNYLIGNDHKNYFETGAGITFTRYHSSDGFSDNGTFSNNFGHLYFGYRLQPANGGFLFRAGLCPVFGNGFFIPYFAGVSLGYKFGRHQFRQKY